MDDTPKRNSKAVIRALGERLKNYFELLKAQFAPRAETDLERAERLARERRGDQ